MTTDLYRRLRSHCAENEARSHRNDDLRSARHSADVPLPVKHRKLHGEHFPTVLQAGLLRHLLLSEVRSRSTEDSVKAASPEGDGRTAEHPARSPASVHRLQSVRPGSRELRAR